MDCGEIFVLLGKAIWAVALQVCKDTFYCEKFSRPSNFSCSKRKGVQSQIINAIGDFTAENNKNKTLPF